MRRIAAVLAGITVLSLSTLVAGIVWAYMTEYGSTRLAVAAAIAAAGAVIAILAYLLVVRICKSTRSSLVLISLLIVALLVPTLSMFSPGKVTYARFGLTVYGAIPVPSLDITVGPNGCLWFRDKSHLVSIEEIEPLLSPGVEALVIGTGWHGAVTVDPAVQELEGIRVHILQTPAAFELFNEYVSVGTVVVLLAHSTC